MRLILRILLLLPAGLFLLGLLWAGGIIALAGAAVARLLRRKTRPDFPPVGTDGVSLIVLNWNGRELLMQSLPRIRAALAHCPGDHEVIVVDNGSTDGSVEWVRSEFPEVRLIVNAVNRGFSVGNNIGVRAARHDLVVLLNNDMLVERDFLKPLIEAHRRTPGLFAATSFIQLPDAMNPNGETGYTRIRVDGGMVYFTHQPLPEGLSGPLCAAYAGGGSSAIDRRKFLALAGFDAGYRPCYVEDADLAFRAWRKGWPTAFVPESFVLHMHRQTSRRRFGDRRPDTFIRRNGYRFIWKNLDGAHLGEHLLRRAGMLLSGCLRGDLTALGDLAHSVLHAPAWTLARWREQGRGVQRAAETLAVANRNDLYRDRHLPRPTPGRGDRLSILLLCPYMPYPPAHGGAQRVYNVTRFLAKRHDVVLISFVERAEEFKHRAALEAICPEVHLVLRHPDERRSVLAPDPWREFRSAEMAALVERVIESRPFDVIQSEWPQMAPYVPDMRTAVTALAEVEVAFVSRRRMAANASSWREKRELLCSWAETLGPELAECRRFDRVFAMSAHEAELLRGYAPDIRASVFPNGIDATGIAPIGGCGARNGHILFVGSFRHPPNVEGIHWFCQNVWEKVRRAAPHAVLTVAGADPPESVRRLQTMPGVEVRGFVPDLQECYRTSVLALAPILTGSGTRIKILEGLAHGMPMVSTRIGAEGLDAEDGEHLFLADDPESFSARTVALLHDPELRRKLGGGGRQLVQERYDWQAIIDRVTEQYFDDLWRKRRCC